MMLDVNTNQIKVCHFNYQLTNKANTLLRSEQLLSDVFFLRCRQTVTLVTADIYGSCVVNVLLWCNVYSA